jgi:hypothetical protein
MPLLTVPLTALIYLLYQRIVGPLPSSNHIVFIDIIFSKTLLDFNLPFSIPRIFDLVAMVGWTALIVYVIYTSLCWESLLVRLAWSGFILGFCFGFYPLKGTIFLSLIYLVLTFGIFAGLATIIASMDFLFLRNYLDGWMDGLLTSCVGVIGLCFAMGIKHGMVIPLIACLGSIVLFIILALIILILGICTFWAPFLLLEIIRGIVYCFARVILLIVDFIMWIHENRFIPRAYNWLIARNGYVNGYS